MWQCRLGIAGDHPDGGRIHNQGIVYPVRGAVGWFALDRLDVQCFTWSRSHRSTLLLSGLLGSASGNGFIESEVLLLEEVLNSISIQEAFNDLVTDVPLSAVIKAKLTSLGQLTEADQEVIESFSGLLCATIKGPSLH